MSSRINNNYFMQKALDQANRAFLSDEVPVGAVIVKDNKIISRAYNQVESKNSQLAHAEILAIQKATKKIGDWRLDDYNICYIRTLRYVLFGY